MSEDPLLFERRGAVARLTLNRPHAANGIDIPLARALLQASIDCDADDSIRCVVLTGAGKMFCGGGDIGAFAAAGDQFPALLKQLTGYLHVAIIHLARMNKPLVTAINGAAAGAGFSLALLGDLAVAARSAKFALAYGGIGLSPDGGATWLLPRLVGLRFAQELAFTGRRLSAEEALAAGLLTRVVGDEALETHVQELAAQLAASATGAVGRTRNLFLSSYGNSFEEQLQLEARAIADAGRGAEGREGIAAFLAKRKPQFTP